MDTLGIVLSASGALIVAACVPFMVWDRLRERRNARRFAARLDAQQSAVQPSGLDLDLLRLRCAVAELRHDVERWERGERS